MATHCKVGVWGQLKTYVRDPADIAYTLAPRVVVWQGPLDNVEQECKALSLDFKLKRETQMLHN